jgi:hypothetical protein
VSLGRFFLIQFVAEETCGLRESLVVARDIDAGMLRVVADRELDRSDELRHHLTADPRVVADDTLPQELRSLVE